MQPRLCFRHRNAFQTIEFFAKNASFVLSLAAVLMQIKNFVYSLQRRNLDRVRDVFLHFLFTYLYRNRSRRAGARF